MPFGQAFPSIFPARTKINMPENKIQEKTGDSFYMHDKERFPNAYEVFKNLKQSLNKK